MMSWCGRYLVLPGDVTLMSFLHLFEFVLQSFQLDFHLLHKLQIPLSALVENLDRLTHILHLDNTFTNLYYTSTTVLLYYCYIK